MSPRGPNDFLPEAMKRDRKPKLTEIEKAERALAKRKAELDALRVKAAETAAATGQQHPMRWSIEQAERAVWSTETRLRNARRQEWDRLAAAGKAAFAPGMLAPKPPSNWMATIRFKMAPTASSAQAAEEMARIVRNAFGGEAELIAVEAVLS